jgi:hypothetical protein
MDPQPAPSAEPAAARAPEVAGAWTPEALRAEADANLSAIKELRVLVLEATRAIQRQLVDPEAPKVVEGDVMLALNRAARALRLTCNLQDRLIKEALRPDGAAAEPVQTHVKVSFVDGPTGELRDRAADARPTVMPSAAEQAAHRAGKAQVLGVVRQVAAAALLPGELSPRDETEVLDRAEREAAERFESESEHDFTRLMRRPLSEVVAVICRDIGLRPDWSVLAREAWSLREMESGTVGAPLAPFAPPPDRPPASPAEAGGGADAHSRFPGKGRGPS